MRPSRSPPSNIYLLSNGDADILIAASQSALDRLIKFANAEDGYGIAELISTKQISKVPSGTKCRIIDPGFMTHEIRILEGLHADEAAFVPAEFVRAADLEEQQYEEQAVLTAAEQEADQQAEQRAAIEEAARYRNWTSISGKHTIEAKIVSYANGVVTLENRSGKKIKVETTKLSDVDRVFIDKWRTERQ
jgi:hypothetical protein